MEGFWFYFVTVFVALIAGVGAMSIPGDEKGKFSGDNFRLIFETNNIIISCYNIIIINYCNTNKMIFKWYLYKFNDWLKIISNNLILIISNCEL